MNDFARRGVTILAALVFAGCLQSETIVKVKPDGSGVVEETVLLSKEAAGQMKMMAGQLQRQVEITPQKGKVVKSFNLFDRERLEKNAKSMGEGVTLLSVDVINTDKSEGYKAVYAFKDINKLKLNIDMSKKMPRPPGTPFMASAKPELKNEVIKFEFVKKGSFSTLLIKTPEKKYGEKRQKLTPGMGLMGGGDAQTRMALAMMKQMTSDMRMSVTVEVGGKIVESNATYQNGSTVTLMEIEFGKIMEDPKIFQKFQEANPKNEKEAKILVKQTPGLKTELQEKVYIKFQ